jgi:hypothetical protein
MMNVLKRAAGLVLLLAVALAVWGLVRADSTKPLSEADLVKLIELQIDDAVIVSKLQKGGISFTVDDATIERLKKAGVSDAVQAAVQRAGKAERPTAPDKTVTFEDVLKLLELGVPEEKILERLAKSPTLFTLGADQVVALKKAGASDKLIKFMQGDRSGGTPVRTVGTPVSKLTDLAIILDCSGSMNEKTKEGRSKMAVAKEVTAELVQKLPLDLLNVTFVIYGHEVYPQDAQRNCQAVKVVRPLSRLEEKGKAELAQFIASLKPAGHAPIALALETAGKELAKRTDAAGGVVLITDGMETCHRNPAEEAAKLAQSLNLTFGVNVIGFDIEAKDRRAVEKIAADGKGTYFPAADAAELNKRVNEVVVKVADAVPKVPDPEKPDGVDTGKTGRRAIKVLQPTTLPLPPMKKMAVTKSNEYGPGSSYYEPIAEVTKYEQEMRLPSAEKHAVWWQPEEGISVLMIKDFSIKEREMVEKRPEEYLGLVRLAGKGLPKPKLIALTKDNYGPDGSYFRPTQTCTAYGKDMVVPAGVYNLWLKSAGGGIAEKLEEKLEVKAGKVTQVE